MKISTTPTDSELEALARYREAAAELAEAWAEWLEMPDGVISVRVLNAMATIVEVEVDGYVVAEPDG